MEGAGRSHSLGNLVKVSEDIYPIGKKKGQALYFFCSTLPILSLRFKYSDSVLRTLSVPAQGNLECLICASHPRQLLSHQIMISCFLELWLDQSISITFSLIHHIDLFRLRITEYEEIMS